MMTEDQIIEAMAESGKMSCKEMLAYMECRYHGKYDKKIARKEAKRLVKGMKDAGIC